MPTVHIVWQNPGEVCNSLITPIMFEKPCPNLLIFGCMSVDMESLIGDIKNLSTTQLERLSDENCSYFGKVRNNDISIIYRAKEELTKRKKTNLHKPLDFQLHF